MTTTEYYDTGYGQETKSFKIKLGDFETKTNESKTTANGAIEIKRGKLNPYLPMDYSDFVETGTLEDYESLSAGYIRWVNLMISLSSLGIIALDITTPTTASGAMTEPSSVEFSITVEHPYYDRDNPNYDTKAYLTDLIVFVLSNDYMSFAKVFDPTTDNMGHAIMKGVVDKFICAKALCDKASALSKIEITEL